MKELEELMQGSGFFNEGFSLGLGDVMELSDEESPSSPSQEEEVPPGSKPKSKGLPSIEGSETCAEFVSKYKRAVLNRRQVFKDAAERWAQEKPMSGKTFGWKSYQFLFVLFLVCDVCV